MSRIGLILILFLFYDKAESNYEYSSKAITSYDLNPIHSSANLTELANIDREYASCGNVEDIREMTIRQFQFLFKTNQLTVYQLVVCYIIRIQKMNPFLHAVIEINPDAKKQALRLDYERFLGYGQNYDNALYGIPILIKDNIATVDKMQTCSGSLALVGYKPFYEASIVAIIRNKGKGIILGKTNLSEFANFRGFGIPNGWSGRGGQTHNPYSMKVDPLGSSTGSAIGVAANLCVCAVGTETDGSVVAPAEKASVVGLKTSHGGVVPIDNIIPISGLTQDTAGPFARTVEDVAIFMSIFVPQNIYGYARSVPYNLDYQVKPSKIYRIGVLRHQFWESNDTTQIQKIKQLNETLVKFGKSPYIKLIDPVVARPGSVEAVDGTKVVITFLHEGKYGINDYLKHTKFVSHQQNEDYSQYLNDHNSYLSQYDDYVQHHLNLTDIIRFNKEHPVPEGYGQEKLEAAEQTDGIRNKTYVNARNENVKAARNLFDYIFKYYSLDAIVAPTIDGWFGTNDASLYSYAAVAGYPYIIVPAGFIDGTFDAIGCIFHGPMFSEYNLLKIASIYEEVTHGREPPSFAP